MKSIKEIRSDFPILSTKVNNHDLIYFDNAATTQKPLSVIQSITEYYSLYNANVHRGVHTLSQEATSAFEQAREKVRRFVNAKKTSEIVFTSGTTHALNLIANGLTSFVHSSDEILILESEHHSNIVPWQWLCQRTNAKLVPIVLDDRGEILWDSFEKMLTEKVKIISIQHVSNVLGNVHPIEKIIEKARAIGAIVVVDAAQSSAHFSIDVQQLDVDFLVTSGHKMFAPTGIGFLYGKERWLKEIPPYQGGGEMIKTVSFCETTFADLPYKFEAGTPNISGAIALGKAIDYIEDLGIENIAYYEHQLLAYATEKLQQLGGVTIYGSDSLERKSSVISMNLENIHSFDVGSILDQMGIAVRTGNHCAQPLIDRYELSGTLRASFAVYNTFEEIDSFIQALEKAQRMLS